MATELDQALRRLVIKHGFQPGTKLENQVALIISRSSVDRPEQQYQVGAYRLDFAWPDVKIAMEADGWWHRSPKGAASDACRDSALRSQGWLVLRVDDEHGEDGLREQVRRVTEVVEACRHPKGKTVYHYFNHPYR